ncbi:MAG: DUF192 domain-containing protein [candidate division Zixibacteria bacterium]|nr:DUF192 domain-containing protein [candidate division Zixibacteria bacterium]
MKVRLRIWSDTHLLKPERILGMIESGIDPANPIMQAVNLSKEDTILAHRVEWAGTSAQRRRGLLGRKGLDTDEAMYIVPCEWIHTFRMQFPIDVAFLAKDGRVLAVHHNLKPNRLSRIVFRAEGALELSAGKLRVTDTEVGDIIELREVDDNS